MGQRRRVDPLNCATKQKEWDKILQKMEDCLNGHHNESEEEEEEEEDDDDDDEGDSYSEDSQGAYERRENMKYDILDDMMKWLVQVRTAGLERTSELQKSRDCLVLCYDTIRALELEYGRGFQTVSLTDESGNVLKTASDLDYCALVCWVLKEVLVAAWASGDASLKALVETTLQERWFEEESLEAELEEGNDGDTDEIDSARHEVASLKKNLKRTKAIAEFKSKPTEQVYKSLLHDIPGLKDDLLLAARVLFLADERPSSIPWSGAFHILSTSGNAEEIDRLLTCMPSVAVEPSTETSRLEAVQFLLQNEATREKGVEYLTESLKLVEKDFMDDLNSAFPGLVRACESLKADISANKVHAYRIPPRAKVKARDEDLDQYVKIALGSALTVPPATRPEGLKTVFAGPGIAERLEGWMGTLKKLPDGQMWAIRKETLGNIVSHPLFKDCGDFAEVLMYRCQSSRKGTEESLRVAFRLFAPKPRPRPPPPPTTRSSHGNSSSQHAGQKRPNQNQGKHGGGKNKKQKQRHN